MRRYAVLFFLLLPMVTPPAYATKPYSPLEVVIVPPSSVKAGKEIRFKVTTVSRIPADELQINIHLVGGVKWGKGEQRWRGKSDPDIPVVMEFSVIAPKTGGFELHAVASVVGKEGGGFGARAIYTYADPAVKSEPKEKKAIRHGKEIVEVPVK